METKKKRKHCQTPRKKSIYILVVSSNYYFFLNKKNKIKKKNRIESGVIIKIKYEKKLNAKKKTILVFL